jgi:hypothetical protein
MAAREDDALEAAVLGVVAHPIVGHITGMHFTEHMRFAHAAGDQLGNL